MVAEGRQSFKSVPGYGDRFLSLFPHRFDYIWAVYPGSNQNPEWQTESRHPLSDRLIQQGSYLYGVRFGPQTQYCVLDIDAESFYHPKRDPFAIARLTSALEPLGLTHFVACTSSYSGGIHLYFPFEQPQKTWQVAIALQTLLQNAGFHIALGQLELFPNAKPYVTDRHPNLYAAHRLPLQIGSYLLNKDWQPIHTTPAAFVDRWRFATAQNGVDAKTIEQLLKTARRKQYGLSGKADKFLNDLNVEIETGWTDYGQTNYILGRIAMRSYVFGHVLYTSHPLEGKPLVDDIVRVATSLPGYSQWCRHQHEIEKRAEEWARSVENSHYFHFQHRKKGQIVTSDSTQALEQTWNQRQREEARERIRGAIAHLLETNALPANATARFHALISYGIGGGSLYRHRDLWHPDHLLPVENPPDPPDQFAVCSRETAGGDSLLQTSTSLLETSGGNPLVEECFSSLENQQNDASGNNISGDKTVGAERVITLSQQRIENDKTGFRWIEKVLRQVKDALQQTQSRETISEQDSANEAMGVLSEQINAQQNQYQARMQRYLESGDPILVAEALRWEQSSAGSQKRSL